MSTLLKRYALRGFVNRGGTPDKKLMIEPDGPWVNYEDYDVLLNELKDGDRDALIVERDQLQMTVNGLVAKYKTLEQERDRLREIVEMAWAGYGDDQEWECDGRVCAAIRTRTPHDNPR